MTTGFGQGVDTAPAYNPTGDEVLPIHRIYRDFWFYVFLLPTSIYKVLHFKHRRQKNEAATLQDLTGMKTNDNGFVVFPFQLLAFESSPPKAAWAIFFFLNITQIISLSCLKLSFTLIFRIKHNSFPTSLHYLAPAYLSSHPPCPQFYSNAKFLSVLWTYPAHSCTGAFLVLPEWNHLSRIIFTQSWFLSILQVLTQKFLSSDMASLKTWINKPLPSRLPSFPPSWNIEFIYLFSCLLSFFSNSM